MTFALEPNPELYAKLAAQWEAEEVRRQHEATRRMHIDCSSYYYLLFFILVMLMLQLSVSAYRFYMSKRRQARRELFAQEGKDVEDVVAVLWADEKVPIVTNDQP